MRSHRLFRGVALAAATILTIAAPSGLIAVHAAPAQAAAPTPTNYGLGAQAFGLTARGGDLPTLPGRVGYVGLGCTNKAGITKQRNIANLDLGATGGVKGISSSVATRAAGKTVTSQAVSKVAEVRLGGSGIGSLSLEAVTTKATARKTVRGYAADATVAALIKLKLPGQASQTLPVPTTGDPIVIPGLLRISLAKTTERHTSSGAYASSQGLVIELLLTDTVVTVGQASARIDAGVVSGVFRGTAAPERVSAAGGLIEGPPQLRGNLGCVGTGGKIRSNGIANADLGPLKLSALSTRVLGTQGAKTARGFTEGKVARVDLGDLVIRGIVGRANVSRTGAKVTSSPNGTTVAKVSFQGETLEFPRNDILTIPGVARLRQHVVERSANGIEVTALELTVLGGSAQAGATVQLGYAQMAIGRAR